LYNFFYRNTTVEFDYQLYSIDGEKRGIIGTSYSRDAGGIASNLEAHRIARDYKNVKLLEDRHNHVDYNPLGILIDYPSGFDRNGNSTIRGGKPFGDRNHYLNMQSLFGKNNIPKYFDVDYTLDRPDFKLKY